MPQVTNENDPTGAVRAHLAVAISRVADPEDINRRRALWNRRSGRRASQAAPVRREQGQLAKGSAMRYTNRYMLAVRQLQSESEGPFLAKLSAEPEYERDVTWALVEWALERSLPGTVWMDGGPIGRGNFKRYGRRAHRAKLRVLMKPSERRQSDTFAPISIPTSRLSPESPDSQTVWRLKTL